MLATYYRLAKPGIVYGNLVAALAGYLYAARMHIVPLELGGFLIGLGLLIGSACVVNNWLDRTMDAAMERTKDRALVSGAISPQAALLYAALLGLVGLGALVISSDLRAISIVLIGYVVYVAIYTPLKPRTYHATLFGAIAGAAPLAAGYVAGAHTVDPLACVLFLTMSLWQMPHFYAIALRRKDEYAAAKVPVASIVLGDSATIVLIRVYIVLFGLVALVPVVLGAAGYTYAGMVTVATTWWLVVSQRSALQASTWARAVFGASLVVLLVLCAALSVASVLP